MKKTFLCKPGDYGRLRPEIDKGDCILIVVKESDNLYDYCSIIEPSSDDMIIKAYEDKQFIGIRVRKINTNVFSKIVNSEVIFNGKKMRKKIKVISGNYYIKIY